MTSNMAIATATEMQNNFGRYLSLVQNGSEVIVTRNGKEVGRFIPKDAFRFNEPWGRRQGVKMKEKRNDKG